VGKKVDQEEREREATEARGKKKARKE